MQNEFDRTNTLQHEQLDAFAVAVGLDGAVVGIAHKAGRGHAWVADQAMRASASVVLNLAEALGREGAHGAGGGHAHRATESGGAVTGGAGSPWRRCWSRSSRLTFSPVPIANRGCSGSRGPSDRSEAQGG